MAIIKGTLEAKVPRRFEKSNMFCNYLFSLNFKKKKGYYNNRKNEKEEKNVIF